MTDDTTRPQLPPRDLPAATGHGTACLIVIGGAQVGEIHRLTRDATVVGRAEDADVRLRDESVSRRHVLLRVERGQASIEELGSRNGTLCNGVPLVGRTPLADGDKITIGGTTILKFTYQDELEQRFGKQLYESAVRDGLTGLHNRRFLEERLRVEMAFARRHRAPLAFMLADLDHFKRVNDDRGHQTGDVVLRAIAKRLSSALRAEDIAARFGGEEFAVLCRGTTTSEALVLAERLRAVAADDVVIPNGAPLRVTVSVGIAVGPQAGIATEVELVRAADAALYEAKRLGRDRVIVSDELGPRSDARQKP